MGLNLKRRGLNVKRTAVLIGLAGALGVAHAADLAIYTTSIGLSKDAPGAATSIHWSFRALTSEYAEVEEVEIHLPSGMGIVAAAFVEKCILTETGPESGEVCQEKYAGSRIGSGKITTKAFGQHTVKGEAYLVDTAKTPGGANVIFYFPSGQVFGAGAQTLFSTMSTETEPVQKFHMKNIQEQLSLPFGMSAELVDGTFAIEGQGGRAPYTNPPSGDLQSWAFKTRLGWEGTSESNLVRASLE